MALITSEQMQFVLFACYEKAINGIPAVAKGSPEVSKSIVDFADENKRKFVTPKMPHKS